MSGPRLTPSEDLVFGLVVARHRLADTPYAIESRHRRTAAALAEKGLVSVESGTVERTFRVSLTVLGELVGISPTHVPGALRTRCRSRYVTGAYPSMAECARLRGHVDHDGTEHVSDPAVDSLGRTWEWSDADAEENGPHAVGPFWDGIRANLTRFAAERTEWEDAYTQGRVSYANGGQILPPDA